MSDPDTMTKVHNEIVGDAVKAIVKPVLDAGGSASDVLVVLESVVVGVLAAMIRIGGEEIVVDAVARNVKKRLAEMGLVIAKPRGRA